MQIKQSGDSRTHLLVGRHHVTSSARFSCVTYGAIGGCLGNCFISPMFIAQACAERHQI
jgi:hypothetical protein